MHKCSVKDCNNMQKFPLFALCNTHMMEAQKEANEKKKNQDPRDEDDSWIHDSDMESRG